VLQLVLADRERLELAEDVGEPEPDELDVLVLDALQDLGSVRSPAPNSFLRAGEPAAAGRRLAGRPRLTRRAAD
jgi:hypothetical protein